MIYGALAVLFIMDGLLIYYILSKQKTPMSEEEWLDFQIDLKTERQNIQKQAEIFRADLVAGKKHIAEQVEKVGLWSAQIEKELQDAPQDLIERSQEAVERCKAEAERGISEFASKQQNLAKYYRKLVGERERLTKILDRIETLCTLQERNLPQEEWLDVIKSKKQDHARYLISRGHSLEDVSKESGLPVEMVHAMRGFL